jgi:fibronectin-binding autotransporter adhesin
LTVVGTTSLDAGTGDITLMNSDNDFTGAVSATGDIIQINDRNALTLGTVNATGNLTVVSNGALDLGTTTVGGALSASSGNGDITQSGALTVVGTTSLDAGTGDITLMNSDNDFTGAVSATGDIIQINDRNALTLGTVNSRGDVLVASRGALNLGTGAIGGELSAESGNGNISQTSALVVTGRADFNAGAGTVLLPNTGNQFLAGTTAKGTQIVIVGDMLKSASDAQASVQGAQPARSTAGTSLSNANPPQLMVLTSTSASSGATGSSDVAAASGGNTSGITVDLRSLGAQEAPMMVAVSLPKGMTTVGTGFSFEMPETVKSMATQNPVLGITQSNGAPLPTWLRFDQATLRFEATAVPDSALPMQLQLNIGGQRVQVVISERTD